MKHLTVTASHGFAHHNLPRFSVRLYRAAVEKHCAVKIARNRVDIMVHGDYALPRADKRLQFFHDGALAPVIHAGERLIEKKQIRILHQSARQKTRFF